MAEKAGKHFSFEEFQVTSTGLDNVAPDWARKNIRALVAAVLDPLRERLGQPIIITSGFRSAAVNKAVKGADDSRHLYGLAADFKCPAFSAEQLVAELVTWGIPFDQALFYHQHQGGHVHVQITRRQAEAVSELLELRANRPPEFYDDGPVRGVALSTLVGRPRIFWVSAAKEYIHQRIAFEFTS